MQYTAEFLKKDPQVTNVIMSDAPGTWFSAGNNITDTPLITLTIYVTEGTNTAEEKSLWLEHVWGYLQDELQIPDSYPNYIVIQDVAGDSWGYNGETQLQRKLKREENPDGV
jgi:4-oxalocrotonate tautomerase